jgi:hypothetical protein
MKIGAVSLILVVLVSLCDVLAQTKTENAATDSLEKLAGDFGNWRARYAPFTGDDVNRIERPGGTRDWSRVAIDVHREDLAVFEARWKKVDASAWPVPKQVAAGREFNLRAFHDYVWKNGNVPIALQRWEYLGVNEK